MEPLSPGSDKKEENKPYFQTVQKRDGTYAPFNIVEIEDRIRSLCELKPVLSSVKWKKIANMTRCGAVDGIKTEDLDELSTANAASFTSRDPEYGILASRIAISNLHKMTPNKFSECIRKQYEHIHPKLKTPCPLISEYYYNLIMENAELFDNMIVSERDYNRDYFSYKTLEKSYLKRVGTAITDRPSYMFLRVAIALHETDYERVKETYEYTSQGYFTHATPTLFNACTPNQQLASCFISGTEVCTVNDGPKKIEDVKIGDLVITHKGNIKPVTQLHRNSMNGRELYTVRCTLSVPITVTGNHRFWAIHNCSNTPEWIPIDRLNEGDYIAIPNNSGDISIYEIDILEILEQNDNPIWSFQTYKETITLHSNKDNTYTNINRKLYIDEEGAFFLGIWIANGYRYFSDQYSGEISFIITKNNEKLVNTIINSGKKLFNVIPDILEQENCEHIRINFRSYWIGKIFDRLFYNHLHSDIYSWNRELVISFISGLTCTAICINQDTDISVQFFNQNLAKEIYHLCRQRGIVVGYNVENEITSILQIPKCYTNLENIEYMNQGLLIRNDTTYVRIEQIQKIEEIVDVVYTLGVADDHSYNVEGLVCENCFLLVNQEDSIEGLYNTFKQLAFISKSSGGIGFAYQDVRASNSYIRGTNGYSKGPIPFAKIANDTSRAVDQGGGKRNGAFAIYNEPWHADIVPFLKMKAVGGDENQRCRDLFPAMWIPDLFFKRVENNASWSLFCPNEAPGLSKVWGDKFEELYHKYENTPGLPRESISAKRLYRKMIGAMIESGLYMCAKDSVNRKSNHQHLGTLECMNLCTEVAQYCSPDEISVCVLASVALPMFVKDRKFDHNLLFKIVRIVTRNLDLVIDKNNYPCTGNDQMMVELPNDLLESDDIEKFREFIKKVKENPKNYIKCANRAERSSKRHRSVGMGVQGLADTFILLGLPFDSEEASQLNKDIFETIYFAALTESVQLAKEKGPYETYHGSPISKGIYQFHFWNVTPSSRWDWSKLDQDRQNFGLRNSLLVAPMPTKSTSHILGNNEAFEPYHSMIFKARVLAGEFDLINKLLINILKERGLWCKDMREKILANRGSVQNIEGFPEDLKPIFKTVWEIKMKTIIDMAADRGPFIDQSQSMNLWLSTADISTIASMIMYAWKKGLKTLCYYLHIRAAADSLAYTVAPEILLKKMMKSENQDDRYTVTTTLDEESILNIDVNPLYQINEEEEENITDDSISKKRKRDNYIQKQEHNDNNDKGGNDDDDDDDDIIICPYDPQNPNKKTCKHCTS